MSLSNQAVTAVIAPELANYQWISQSSTAVTFKGFYVTGRGGRTGVTFTGTIPAAGGTPYTLSSIPTDAVAVVMDLSGPVWFDACEVGRTEYTDFTANYANTTLAPVGANIFPPGSIPWYDTDTIVIDAYTQPAQASWTSATVVNTAFATNTEGMDTVVLTYVPTGTITGGVITFEVYDGTTWVPMRIGRSSNYATELSYALAGGQQNWQIGVAGYQMFRARLSTIIAGSGTALLTTITSSTPDVPNVTVGLDTSTLAAGDGQAALPISGSTFTQTGTLTGANGAGAAIIAPFEVSNFNGSFDLVVGSIGTGGSSFSVAFGPTATGPWSSSPLVDALQATSNLVTTTNASAANHIFRGPVAGLWCQVVQNGAQSSGTSLAYLTASTVPFTMPGYAATGAATGSGNGTSPYQNGALSNTVVAVKASAGNLYDYELFNAGASAACIEFFNAATGSVTLGTTVPFWHVWVPAGGHVSASFALAKSFGTAISLVAVTTYNGSTAPATAVDVCIGYN